MTFHAYAAPSPGAPLEPFDYEPAPLAAHDVEIAVTHCGICHSDVHLIDDDWGAGGFPLVAGHEIVGVVEDAGSEARRLLGRRVGVGWQRSACLDCDLCRSGRDNLCRTRTFTCLGDRGGFADRIRVDGRFAFPIPDDLSSEGAAPLMCAGATVFSPLRRWVVPRMRVGVIGIGGLGHLAVRFAAAMGCEVTAFSTSPGKEDEARALGAHRFVATIDPEMTRATRGTLDFVLSTVNADVDWGPYTGSLAPDGHLCLVGIPEAPMSIHARILVGGQRIVSGSAIGSRTAITDMLDFAARHGITAITEAYPMGEVNAALDRVRVNRVRYRAVLSP
jgi:alcohol/geraniol dehydrogenase (NADP+)